MKTLNSFLHRRSNHGGRAGNRKGQKTTMAFAVRKFMLRRFLWVLEAMSADKEIAHKM